MALETMYPAVNGSLPTQITAAIAAAAQSIEVEDASVLPVAPNLLTISMDDSAEVVRYGAKEGNTLRECLRGFGGTTAQSWPQGTICYRAYTAEDHRTFVENILRLGADAAALAATKQDAALLAAGAFAEFGQGSGDVARGNHTHAEYLTEETDPTVPAWAKAPQKPAYTAAEVNAVPTGRKVNGKVLSADVTLLAADVGASAAGHTHAEYLVQETDPTVPAWAKSPDKPAYTPDEIGAVAVVAGKADADRTSAAIEVLTSGRALMPSDKGKLLLVTSESPATITIPASGGVDFPLGTEIEIRQQGAGLVAVEAAAGVQLTSFGGRRKSMGQYAFFTLKKLDTDGWALAGELEE